MKTLKYVLWSAMALVLSGCSQEDELLQEVAPDETPRQIEITVGVSEQPDSRVSYDDQTNTPFAWEPGDTLAVVGYSKNKYKRGTSYFTLVDDIPGMRAVFRGELVQDAELYKLYYKSKRFRQNSENLGQEEPYIDYSGQTELVTSSTAHMKDFYYLATNEFLTPAELETKEHNLTLQNSILRLEVKSLPQEIGTLRQISVQTNQGTPKSSTISLNTTQSAAPFVAFILFDPIPTAQQAGNDLSIVFRGDRIFRVKAVQTKATLNQGGRRYRQTVARTPEELEGGKGLAEWKELTPFGIDNVNHKITVPCPGLITTEMIKEAIAGSTELKVEGPLDGNDMRNIREAAGCVFNAEKEGQSIPTAIITALDLSKASFVGGGYPYAQPCTEFNTTKKIYLTQEANVFSPFMFFMSQLTSLTLPEGITKIGNCALFLTQGLKVLTIPSTVKELEEYAFTYTSIEELTIPEKCTIWKDNAFTGLIQLKKITINAPITSIPPFCFEFCTSMQSITIPNTVETIGENAFQESGLTALVIPKNVKNIANEIFYACQSLTSLTIAGKKGETTIHQEAFSGFSTSANCDLTLDSSWEADITTDPDGTQKFMGVPFKSIKTLEKDPSFGFDGITKEDML